MTPLRWQATLSAVLLYLIAAAYCAAILSLPLFPTQDGPIHLYFVRVLQALVFHVDPGIYPRFYTVKHLVPPYALYYYLLILLERFAPPALADKLVTCLYVVLFLTGFRLLARSIGPRGDIMALLATPLTFCWPLAMGFVNFCLSTALAFFALGLWCGFTSKSSVACRVAFVALCFLILLTHPVPLILVLSFCTVDLAVRCLRSARPIEYLRNDLLALLAASSTLLYLRAFTATHALHQAASTRGYFSDLQQNAPSLILLHTLLPFAGGTFLDVPYRLAIVAILLTCFVLGRRDLRQSLRLRRWTRGNTWYVAAIGLAVSLPFLPSDLNGSHFFAARLVLIVWLAMLAGACGSWETAPSGFALPGWAPLSASLFAVAATALVLLLGLQRIFPIAKQVNESETVPLHGVRQVTLMLLDQNYAERHTLNFDPYRWSGARVLRRTDSVLYNTPWLDLPIIPLGQQPDLPTSFVNAVSLEYGPYLRRDLLANTALRVRVLSQVDTVLINHGNTNFNSARDPILASDPGLADTWTCAAASVYQLCERR